MSLLSNPSFESITRQLRRLGNRLLPSHCLLCGETLNGELICAGCLLDLPHLPSGHCEVCSLPLAVDAGSCGHCLHRPPPFSRSLIPYVYGHPLDRLLHRFKYRRQMTCGRLLAQLLRDHVLHQGDNLPDLIVPVPLHWSRRLLRGFNQAEELALPLGRALGVPVHSRLCRRRRATANQQKLGRQQRQRNLRGAFVLTPGARDIVAGKSLALVDDVVTTTATLRQLARLFSEAGADDIQVWALARTPEAVAGEGALQAPKKGCAAVVR